MPTLVRWYLKTSLLYLIAALLVGAALAGQSVLNLPPGTYALGPVYLHLFMFGWVAQLIFGVVYWMFPKHSKENPRGSERLALATYLLLNAGLLLRVVAEPLHALADEPLWGGLLALSALLQWLAGMGFVLNTWGRVKER